MGNHARTARLLSIFTVFACSFVPATKAAGGDDPQEYRTWRSTQGITWKAKLVEDSGDRLVQLKTTDGKALLIERVFFCAEDMQYLDTLWQKNYGSPRSKDETAVDAANKNVLITMPRYRWLTLQRGTPPFGQFCNFELAYKKTNSTQKAAKLVCTVSAKMDTTGKVYQYQCASDIDLRNAEGALAAAWSAMGNIVLSGEGEMSAHIQDKDGKIISNVVRVPVAADWDARGKLKVQYGMANSGTESWRKDVPIHLHALAERTFAAGKPVFIWDDESDQPLTFDTRAPGIVRRIGYCFKADRAPFQFKMRTKVTRKNPGGELVNTEVTETGPKDPKQCGTMLIPFLAATVDELAAAMSTSAPLFKEGDGSGSAVVVPRDTKPSDSSPAVLSNELLVPIKVIKTK